MKSILVFQTDFTYKEGAVSAMYGVVKSVDRELEILDASHEIPQYDIWSATYRLYQSMRFWPKGTIFVSVVDPGVGTSRRACVAKTSDGYFVVTPDNGTLTLVKNEVGILEVREIDEKVNRLKGKNTELVSVFNGRDVFAYCAARLASGIITFEQVGPAYDIDQIISLPVLQAEISKGVVRGIFEINDPNFGNLWTNIPLDLFTQAGFRFGEKLKMKIMHQDSVVFNEGVLFHKSFGFASKGEVIIYNNELMRIGVAISQGNFCQTFNINYGPDWQVEFSR